MTINGKAFIMYLRNRYSNIYVYACFIVIFKAETMLMNWFCSQHLCCKVSSDTISPTLQPQLRVL